MNNALLYDTAFYNARDKSDKTKVIKEALNELLRLRKMKERRGADLPFITGMEAGIKTLIKNAFGKII